jgi:hypothetical protein
MIPAKLKLKAEVTSRVGASEQLLMPGDVVLVTRGEPRWLLMRCPCGCGEEIPVNLDKRAGKAWRLFRSAAAGLTLFPSVWRDTGCRSHFIIWRDRIVMCGIGYGSKDPVSFDVETLSKRVLAAWPRDGFASYVTVADAINEIPWDVSDACNLLVKRKKLVEASGESRGWYQRV